MGSGQDANGRSWRNVKGVWRKAILALVINGTVVLLAGCGTPVVPGISHHNNSHPVSPVSKSPPTYHIVGHAQVVPGGGPSISTVMREIAHANDPHLPPVVATINGQAITRRAVSQAEVLLAQAPTAPAAGKPLETAALNLIIHNVLVQSQAARSGLDPSYQSAKQALEAQVSHPNPAFLSMLQAMGKTPQTYVTNAAIIRYQRTMGGVALRRSVLKHVPPAQQAGVWYRYVASLVSKAHVQKSPGF